MAKNEIPTIEVRRGYLRIQVAAAVKALARDGRIYRRGNKLVQIERSADFDAQLESQGGAFAAELMKGRLDEILATGLVWVKRFSYGLDRIDPPLRVVRDIFERGTWPEIPLLNELRETPCILPSGSVLERPGYLKELGLLYAPRIKYSPVLPKPDHSEAKSACLSLLEPFRDFPFASQEHRSVLLTAILTFFARPAIDGPVPLFLIEGNVRGVGKSLLSTAIGVILTGRILSRTAYPEKDEEFEKVLAGMVLSAEPVIMIDNINRAFGHPMLDMILTSEAPISLRLLGKTGNLICSARTIFLATANNAVLKGDLSRRTLQMRLVSDNEYPERRKDFQHRDLLRYLKTRHPSLVYDALTILRAYVVANYPCQNDLIPLGGYLNWAKFVQGACLWVTGYDPVATQACLESAEADDRRAAGTLFETWYEHFKESSRTTREVWELVEQNTNAALARDALQQLCTVRNGDEMPNVKALGQALRRLKDTSVGGKRLRAVGEDRNGILWKIAVVK